VRYKSFVLRRDTSEPALLSSQYRGRKGMTYNVCPQSKGKKCVQSDPSAICRHCTDLSLIKATTLPWPCTICLTGFSGDSFGNNNLRYRGCFTVSLGAGRALAARLGGGRKIPLLAVNERNGFFGVPTWAMGSDPQLCSVPAACCRRECSLRLTGGTTQRSDTSHEITSSSRCIAFHEESLAHL
jgi:hypothetical protein